MTSNVSQPLEPIDPLRLDLPALVAAFGEHLGRGEYHAEYVRDPNLGDAVAARFPVRLPEVCGRSGDGSTYKFLLRLRDGLESESVVIAMTSHKSLCVSSQVGCKMGCTFCETARLGHLRDLDAGEIVAQVLVARHVLGEPVENVVFMGMGEPMGNLDRKRPRQG